MPALLACLTQAPHPPPAITSPPVPSRRMAEPTLVIPWLYVGFNGTGNYYLEPGAQLSVPSEILGVVEYGVQSISMRGTNTVSSLTVGERPTAGAYYQYGGQLSAANETFGITGSRIGPILSVGRNQYGVFHPDRLGDSASYYVSVYGLSGSGQLSAFAEYVGYSANGSSFTQSGGTNTVTNALFLGYNAGSNGSYGLSNGLCSTWEKITPMRVIGPYREAATSRRRAGPKRWPAH